MNTTKEIQTYSPIGGLHVCANGTGHYVEKADYERLREENARLSKGLADWMACACELAEALKYEIQCYNMGETLQPAQQALKQFEELSR